MKVKFLTMYEICKHNPLTQKDPYGLNWVGSYSCNGLGWVGDFSTQPLKIFNPTSSGWIYKAFQPYQCTP